MRARPHPPMTHGSSGGALARGSPRSLRAAAPPPPSTPTAPREAPWAGAGSGDTLRGSVRRRRRRRRPRCAGAAASAAAANTAMRSRLGLHQHHHQKARSES